MSFFAQEIWFPSNPNPKKSAFVGLPLSCFLKKQTLYTVLFLYFAFAPQLKAMGSSLPRNRLVRGSAGQLSGRVQIEIRLFSGVPIGLLGIPVGAPSKPTLTHVPRPLVGETGPMRPGRKGELCRGDSISHLPKPESLSCWDLS